MATARILHLVFIDGDNQENIEFQEELKPRQNEFRVKNRYLAELPISFSLNENNSVIWTIQPR
jgi:hypothetical protein